MAAGQRGAVKQLSSRRSSAFVREYGRDGEPAGRPRVRWEGREGSERWRVSKVDPERTERRVRAVLEAQARRWGAPLLNHLLYARRPSIFGGVRAMWAGLDASGLLDPGLVALVNRRVAALNGCVF